MMPEHGLGPTMLARLDLARRAVLRRGLAHGVTPGRHRRRRAGAAGFSLVEMLVVLAVLGLVAGLAGPSLGTLLPGRRLDAAASALSGELIRLRAQARRTGLPAGLTFDPLRAVFVSARPGAVPIVVGDLAVEVLRGEASRAAPGEIRFLADGSSTGGAIRLTGRGGSRILAVSSLTGRVATDLPR